MAECAIAAAVPAAAAAADKTLSYDNDEWIGQQALVSYCSSAPLSQNAPTHFLYLLYIYSYPWNIGHILALNLTELVDNRVIYEAKRVCLRACVCRVSVCIFCPIVCVEERCRCEVCAVCILHFKTFFDCIYTTVNRI